MRPGCASSNTRRRDQNRATHRSIVTQTDQIDLQFIVCPELVGQAEGQSKGEGRRRMRRLGRGDATRPLIAF